MDHLLVHTLEVLRSEVIGNDDGTPIWGDAEPVAWANGRMSGACRLDTPRESSFQNPDGTRTTVFRSDVLCGLGCPVRELDRVRVTTDRGTEVWQAGGISDAGGMHGAHHLEVKVSREIHP